MMRNSRRFAFVEPGAAGYAHPMVLPGDEQSRFPPVDEHVVEPETRQEMIDGRIVYASPAHLPHAYRQAWLDSVLSTNVAPGYVSAADMLTRTSEGWNFAADASIRKLGTDPATGHRYLEELAFEIKYTQSMKDITARARQLADRGVRRVFMICVHGKKRGNHDEIGPTGPVMEWSVARNRWIELAPDALIEDPCLRQPIRVRALLDTIEAKKAVARGLLAEDNPVLAEAIDAARTEAETKAQAAEDRMRRLADAERRRARASIYAILDARGLGVPETVRAQIDGCEDIDRLTAWLRCAVTAASAGDICG
jgi:hypothetical protein